MWKVWYGGGGKEGRGGGRERGEGGGRGGRRGRQRWGMWRKDGEHVQRGRRKVVHYTPLLVQIECDVQRGREKV